MNAIHYTLLSPRSSEEFERYYEFRWQQLRKPLNLPKGSEQDPLDQHSFHCMALDAKQTIIGVASIQPNGEHAMRVRYMAVAEQYRRIGVASAIMRELFRYAEENHCHSCWLNARDSAIEFYQRHGFEVVSKINSDLDIPHSRMEIKLS